MIDQRATTRSGRDVRIGISFRKTTFARRVVFCQYALSSLIRTCRNPTVREGAKERAAAPSLTVGFLS